MSDKGYRSKNVDSGNTDLDLAGPASSAYPLPAIGEIPCTTDSSKGNIDTGFRYGTSVIYTKKGSWKTVWSGSLYTTGSSTKIYEISEPKISKTLPTRITLTGDFLASQTSAVVGGTSSTFPFTDTVMGSGGITESSDITANMDDDGNVVIANTPTTGLMATSYGVYVTVTKIEQYENGSWTTVWTGSQGLAVNSTITIENPSAEIAGESYDTKLTITGSNLIWGGETVSEINFRTRSFSFDESIINTSSAQSTFIAYIEDNKIKIRNVPVTIMGSEQPSVPFTVTKIQQWKE